MQNLQQLIAGQPHVAPGFRAAFAGKEFSDAEPARMNERQLREYYGIPDGPDFEHCQACDQPHEKLTETLDGLTCDGCLAIAAEQAEADLTA